MAKDKQDRRFKEMSPRANAAYGSLDAAIRDLDDKGLPLPCKDNDLFVMDYISGSDLAYLCRTCLVFVECETFASIAKPEAGVWAGRRWNRNKEQPVVLESEN
jgi:hypothetical protein